MDRFQVFPNPFQHQLTLVQSNGVFLDGEIAIYSITGKLLDQRSFNTNRITLDLSGFASGLYILMVRDLNTGEQMVTRVEKAR